MSGIYDIIDWVKEDTGINSTADAAVIRKINYNELPREKRELCSVVGCYNIRKKGTRTTLCARHYKQTRFKKIPINPATIMEKKEREWEEKEQKEFRKKIRKGIREEGQTGLKS